MEKYLIAFLFLMTGCVTSRQEQVKTVMDQYEALQYEDGVDLNEAKTIAQRELIKQHLTDRYALDKVKVVRDVSELPHHENHWFLSFHEINDTSIEYIFMVVIDKTSGKVKFADDIQDGKWWIIEAALLK